MQGKVVSVSVSDGRRCLQGRHGWLGCIVRVSGSLLMKRTRDRSEALETELVVLMR